MAGGGGGCVGCGRGGSGSCQDDEAHEDEAQCLPQANKRIHTHTQTQKDDSEIRSPSHANTHQYTPILTHTYIPHVAAAEGTDSFLPLPFVFIYCFFL